MAFQQRRKKLGHERLLQHFGQTHVREQRNQFRNEFRILARFNHQGKLHGGLRHFDSGFGAFVKCAVDNVRPADQLRHRRRVKTETGLRDVGDETGARSVVWVVEVAIARAAVPLAFQKVLLIRGVRNALR